MVVIEAVIQVMTHINSLYKFGSVTDAMKIGTHTPIYEKKGLSTDAKNYRGITVLPVITNILEAVIRDQISPSLSNCRAVLKENLQNTPPHELLAYIGRGY